jgi:hypothetical protein
MRKDDEGECQHLLKKTKLYFPSHVPAVPLAESNVSSSRDFVVPDDTWAIAIDDSRIQRKIVTHLAECGVDRSQLIETLSV